jgi:hypothetical protein
VTCNPPVGIRSPFSIVELAVPETASEEDAIRRAENLPFVAKSCCIFVFPAETMSPCDDERPATLIPPVTVVVPTPVMPRFVVDAFVNTWLPVQVLFEVTSSVSAVKVPPVPTAIVPPPPDNPDVPDGPVSVVLPCAAWEALPPYTTFREPPVFWRPVPVRSVNPSLFKLSEPPEMETPFEDFNPAAESPPVTVVVPTPVIPRAVVEAFVNVWSAVHVFAFARFNPMFRATLPL